MRIAAGMVYHESNTFFSQAMTLDKFREKDLHFGPEITSHWKDTCSEMGGFIEEIRRSGFELVPILAAWGMPAGSLTNETFAFLSQSLLSSLEQEGPLDGVLLALHGAMVSDTYPDADGELLRRVREVIGPKTPLVVTLDYHANMTEEMVRWPDAIVGYDTCPHVDQFERGVEAVRILEDMLKRGLWPRVALVRRPLFPHILRQLTGSGPMADAMRLAHELEQQPGIISISAAAGFPYSDVPDAGFSVYAVAREDVNIGLRAAEQIAEFVWQRRDEFQVQLPMAEAAVAEALSQPAGLTVLADVGDNLGAGTPGDGTVLLQQLISQGARAALVLLCDPEAVAAAINAGVREKVKLTVGGKVDGFHGPPVEMSGIVRTLSDGVYQNVGPMRDGVVDDQGRTAVIDTDGVLLVLTERRMPMWNLQQLRSLGIEPTRLRIICVKSSIAYRAAYEPIARRTIEVDTPGLAAADVNRFKYKKLKRPIYPLDPLEM